MHDNSQVCPSTVQCTIGLEGGGVEQSDFYVTLLANAVPMTCRNVDIRRWQRLSVTQLPSFPWNSEGIRNPSLSGAI